jgi:hypothetical protein
MTQKHLKSKKFVLPERKKEGTIMIRSLGILIGGVFVGAVCAEIIRKKYPKAMNDVYAKTREITSGVTEAFKKGYANAMQSQQAAEPSA